MRNVYQQLTAQEIENIYYQKGRMFSKLAYRLDTDRMEIVVKADNETLYEVTLDDNGNYLVKICSLGDALQVLTPPELVVKQVYDYAITFKTAKGEDSRIIEGETAKQALKRFDFWNPNPIQSVYNRTLQQYENI